MEDGVGFYRFFCAHEHHLFGFLLNAQKDAIEFVCF
jgi:hypothetical protein